MKMRNLIIACVVLAALSGGVYYANKHPKAAESSSDTPAATKLVTVPESQVDAATVTRNGTAFTVKQQGGKWVIDAPEKANADQSAVSGLLSPFNPLNADTVADEHATNLAQFGLDAPAITVSLHEKSGKTVKLDVGSEIPAASLVYVRLDNGPKVYAVASSVKSSLDKGFADVRDKRLLTFAADKVSGLEITGPSGLVSFTKNAQGDWQIVKPKLYRADGFAVEEILRKLGDAKMEVAGGPDDQKKNDASFAAGQPVGTAKVIDASGTETLDVRKNKDDYYAKSSLVPGTYKIAADVGQALDKKADDLRNKKLFDFGFSDPNTIDVQAGGTTQHLVLSGTDWKRNGQTMDPGGVQAVIDKLRDLAASKFVTTGFTSPAATITVVSKNGSRTEKVQFAKSAAGGYIGQRDNDSTLYQIEAKSVDDILDAAKAIKQAAPPVKK